MFFKKNLFKFKTILTLFICSVILIMIMSGCTNNENQISGGVAQYQYYSEENKPMDTYESYSFLEYINKKSSESPFILYSAESIAKDVNPDIFVIKNDKCRKYNTSYTLGELSQMTDEDIIGSLVKTDIDNLAEFLPDISCEFQYYIEDEYYLEDEFNYDLIELYKPTSYDITACLFTDDSGNYVESELILFPVKGISDKTNVVKYPVTDTEILNYYTIYRAQSDRSHFYFDNVHFFNKGDINETNETFHINNNSSAIITGEVYESIYYGFNTVSSNYAKSDGVLFFRDDNAYALNIGLDNLSSENISYIDPTGDDILDIYWEYYNNYYDNFSNEYYLEAWDLVLK